MEFFNCGFKEDQDIKTVTNHPQGFGPLTKRTFI